MHNSDIDFLCLRLGTEFVASNISKHCLTKVKLEVIARKFSSEVKTGKAKDLSGLFFRLIREVR